MPANSPSRRDFLYTTGTAAGGAWIASQLPAVAAARAWAAQVVASGERPAFEYLTEEEAAVIEAISARIVPSDDTPGAREAGVMYFADRTLGASLRVLGDSFRSEYPDFTALVRDRYPEADSFADLPEVEQDALLRDIEDDSFFAVIRTITVFGMFSDPSHGGNRDEAGWRLIGFEDRHMWSPPFGYYDRGHHGEEG